MEFNKVIATVSAAFLLLVMAVTIMLQQGQIEDLHRDLNGLDDELKAAQHEPTDNSELYDIIDSLQVELDSLYMQLGAMADEPDEWFCPLTEQEFELATRVVMAESGNQPYAGQLAVAQCIYDRMQRDDQTLSQVVLAENQFATPYDGQVTDSVIEATYAVFHSGIMVCNEPIYYFYSTRNGFYSAMHERQNYIMTINDHKFFN